MYTHRGWAYVLLNAWEPALADFQRALSGFAPSLRSKEGGKSAPLREALIGRGLALIMLDRAEAGLLDAESALAGWKPSTDDHMFNLSCLFAQASVRAADPAARKKSLERALDWLEAALKAVPDPGAYWHKFVVPDRLLEPLCGSPRYCKLAALYSPE